VSDYLSEPRVRSLLAHRHGYKERRKDGYKVPDALFQLRTLRKTFQVAVELELSLKNRMYIDRILRQLVTSLDFNLVFLVLKTHAMLQRYQSTLKLVRANDSHVQFGKRDNGIYFCVLSDLLRDREKTKFLGEEYEFDLAALASEGPKPTGI
jgi:hypothetical protein